jgi:hypothetical protein
VVDDSAANRGYLGSLLEVHGFIVDRAEDAERAVAIALTDPPDLVLMDLRMPRVCGYAARPPGKARKPPRFLDSLVVVVVVIVVVRILDHDYDNDNDNDLEIRRHRRGELSNYRRVRRYISWLGASKIPIPGGLELRRRGRPRKPDGSRSAGDAGQSELPL